MKFFLLGAIQGITEFLPISSDGHLFLLKRLLGITDNYLPFFVFLHIPTLLAVVIFFRKDLVSLLTKKFFLIQVIILTFISGIIALLIKHSLEPFFDNKYLVSICFALNALILFNIKFSRENTVQDLKTKDSLIIGVLQAFAVLPGVSRSGSTIMGFSRRKFRVDRAFLLSFIISLPIILAAFLVESKDLMLMKDIKLNSLIIGFISALFFGIITLKIVKVMLSKFNFNVFGYYCLVVAILNLFL